jgi:hypothetical protein
MMHNQKMRRNQLEKKRKELETAARASKKKRDKRLDEAREALKEQVRMQTRRETREKKRRQIALEVAGDLGEEEEQRLKKQFVTKQMYSTFLAGKLEKNVARSSALQQGFQKIKNATGLSDVDDILQKYLTRDETYESLVKAAKETEAQIEVAQAEQRALQSSLESIQLQGVAGQGNRTLYREIDQFDTELSEARKQCNEYKDRSVRASMTLEDVRQCVVKLARKLDMPSDTKELPSPESLPNILKNIEEKVKGIVESLSDYVGAQDAIVAAGGGGLGSSGKEGGGNAPGAGEKDGGVAENSAGSAPAGPAATKKKESLLRQKAAAAVASETKTSNSKSGGSKTGGGAGETADARSMIGARARDLLYNSLMAVEPDTSSRNIRVLSKASAAEQEKMFVYNGAPPLVASQGRTAKKSTGSSDGGKVVTDKKSAKGDEQEDEEEDGGDVIDRQALKGLGEMLVQAQQQKQRKAEARAIALAEAEEKNGGKPKKRRSDGRSLTSGKSIPSSADTRRLEMLLGKDNATTVRGTGEHFKSDVLRQPTRPSSGGSKGSGKTRRGRR